MKHLNRLRRLVITREHSLGHDIMYIHTGETHNLPFVLSRSRVRISNMVFKSGHPHPPDALIDRQTDFCFFFVICDNILCRVEYLLSIYNFQLQ